MLKKSLRLVRGVDGGQIALATHPLLPSLPMLGLGTADNGGCDETMSVAVATAAQCGVRLFDTAQNYGSEAALGEGLRRAGLVGGQFDKRDRALFLSCKVDLCSPEREDPALRVRRQVASTLANVGVTTLDSVIIHWPICLDNASADHGAARRGAWQALEALVREGTVTHIGVSNWTAPLLDELLTYARIPPALNQVEVSPVCYQRELLDFCSAAKVAVMGYSPLGSCWMARYWPAHVPHGVTELVQHVDVRTVAAEAGCTPAQALLSWSLHHGVVAIPKSVRPERIGASLQAPAVRLSSALVERLNALNDPQRGTEAAVEAHLRVIASQEYEWEPT